LRPVMDSVQHPPNQRHYGRVPVAEAAAAGLFELVETVWLKDAGPVCDDAYGKACAGDQEGQAARRQLQQEIPRPLCAVV